MFRSHRYLLLSAVAGLVVVAILLFAYRSLTMTSLVDQEERASVGLASILAHAILPGYPFFLAHAGELSDDEIRSHQDIVALDSQVKEYIVDSNVIKVLIIEADGRVLYSTTPSQIGASKSDSDGFRKAMTGVAASQFSFRDNFTGAHAVYSNRNVVST